MTLRTGLARITRNTAAWLSPGPNAYRSETGAEPFLGPHCLLRTRTKLTNLPAGAWGIGPGQSERKGQDLTVDQREIEAEKVTKILADLDALTERRAKATGAERANAEAALLRASDARRTRAARLENARAWVEHYGALALAAHDTAARYAEKRDEARALVHDLEEESAA